MTPEFIVKLIADVRADEREQCCRDICTMCRTHGISCSEVYEDLRVWVHDDEALSACLASEIRERHYQQQEGKGE